MRRDAAAAVSGAAHARGEPSPRVYHRSSLGSRLRTGWAATRPAFFSVSVLPVLVGLALVDGPLPHPVLGLLTLASMVLIHAGANVLNDYYDAAIGTDAVNRTHVFPFSGGSRFIQNGILAPAETARLGRALLALAGVIGAFLVVHGGAPVLLMGVVGVGIAIAYSLPRGLASRGLGDAAIVLCFGVLPVLGTVYVQRAVLDPQAAWLGLGIGCFTAAILWVNSLPDIEADRATGKLTLPARIGRRRAGQVHGAWFALGLLAIASGSHGPWAWLPWAVLVVAIPACVELVRACRQPADGREGGALARRRLRRAIVATIAAHAGVCALVLASVLLSSPSA